MSWLRIDDGFASHEKVSGLSAAALQLWIRCGCWCSRGENLITRGFVPERKAVEFCGGSKARADKLARELVDARGEPQYGHEHGLWEPEQGGWRFHDWDRYRPKEEKTTEEVSNKRSAAGKRGAQARWQTNGKQDGNCHGKNDGKPLANYAPDPDPDPDPGSEAAAVAASVVDLSSENHALASPILDRSRALLQRQDLALWCNPQGWPEVIGVAAEFESLTGQSAHLGQWSRDAGLRNLIAVFAAGYSPKEVCDRLRVVVGSDWWKERRRGLSSVTVEVLRRSESPLVPTGRKSTPKPRQPDSGYDLDQYVAKGETT